MLQVGRDRGPVAGKQVPISVGLTHVERECLHVSLAVTWAEAGQFARLIYG